MSLSVNKTKCSSLHFVGILGVGMSAIAQYLKWNSIEISGSDRLANDSGTKHVRDALESAGCGISKQDGSGISSKTDALVVSTAIEETNPDYIKARSLNIPIFHRSDVLASIVNTKKTIAVTGTSGKSTVTALIFHLLSRCGKKPSLISGANLNGLAGKGIVGNAYSDASELFVIEADESDGSLVKYRPYLSVFLNLTKDHKPIKETLGFFHTFAKQSENVFVNFDDKLLRSIQPAKTFGLDKNADFCADKIELGRTSVAVHINNTRFSFPFPGKHNACNLLAALSACKFLGCDDDALSGASSTYKGIGRRFQSIETGRGVTVIDDYAHNPEKIQAVLETAQNMSSRVFAIYQPHGFAPTKFLLREYIGMFNKTLRPNDILYLPPIYYVGGTTLKDVSSEDIAEGLKNCQGKVETPQKRDDIAVLIASMAKSGDIVLSMGARDPSLPAFAKNIAEAIDKT
ncbi:UDP-N-acetylmuramate--L-alanine ligase [Elusimicrobiota bacterium]